MRAKRLARLARRRMSRSAVASGGSMDGLITTLTFLVLTVFLFGLAGVVKPFWFMKKRWHGGAIAGGCFVAFTVLNNIPVTRPAHISQADWAERVQACREVAQVRECPTNEAMVAEARTEVAEKARKASVDEQIRTAERTAEEAERLADARNREIAAAGDAAVASAEKLDDPTQQALWIARTEIAVRDKMRDPGAVRFRNNQFVIFQNQTPMVCGEINATNGFGGRTGFQRFIASGETFGPVLEQQMSQGEFARTWNQICV